MMILAFPFITSATNVEIDGIWYDVITKAGANSATVIQSQSTAYSGDIVIPSSVNYNGIECDVTSIGKNAFYACHGLTSITIPNSVTIIGEHAFFDCYGISSFIIPNSVTTIEMGAFFNCDKLNSITLPNSLKSISNQLFFSCSNLTSVTIPNSVTSIGASAFEDCVNLKSITIPSSVTTIGNRAFINCSRLVSVTIPNSVTSIGGSSFADCSSLTSVTIGSSVKSIGSAAFSNCGDLADVYCLAKAVPSTKSDAFKDSYPEYITLHVPASSVEAYKASQPWSGFYQIIPLDEEPSSIDNVQEDANVIVKYDNGNVIVNGTTEGTTVNIYDATGKSLATQKANGNATSVNVPATNGNILIVKVGNRSIKIKR